MNELRRRIDHQINKAKLSGTEELDDDERIDAILDAVIAALPQLKKRSEGNHDYLLGRSHGFDDGIDEVKAILQSAKENR